MSKYKAKACIILSSIEGTDIEADSPKDAHDKYLKETVDELLNKLLLKDYVINSIDVTLLDDKNRVCKDIE